MVTFHGAVRSPGDRRGFHGECTGQWTLPNNASPLSWGVRFRFFNDGFGHAATVTVAGLGEMLVEPDASKGGRLVFAGAGLVTASGVFHADRVANREDVVVSGVSSAMASGFVSGPLIPGKEFVHDTVYALQVADPNGRLVPFGGNSTEGARGRIFFGNGRSRPSGGQAGVFDSSGELRGADLLKVGQFQNKVVMKTSTSETQLESIGLIQTELEVGEEKPTIYSGHALYHLAPRASGRLLMTSYYGSLQGGGVGAGCGWILFDRSPEPEAGLPTEMFFQLMSEADAVVDDGKGDGEVRTENGNPSPQSDLELYDAAYRRDAPRPTHGQLAEILGEEMKRLPPGALPETYGMERVDHIFAQEIASFLLVSPVGSEPIPPRDGSQEIDFSLSQNLHRFEVRTAPGPNGLAGGHAMSLRPSAWIEMEWRFIAPDAVLQLGEELPPVAFEPQLAQRFQIRGKLTFGDHERSSVEFFGDGRTFPDIAGDSQYLSFGMNLVVIHGTGLLRGRPGMIVINALQAQNRLDFTVLLRVGDPGGELQAMFLPPMELSPEDPTPDSQFLLFYGINDPTDPTQLLINPQGEMEGADLRQQQYLAQTGFEDQVELRSLTVWDEVVCRMRAKIYFDLLAPPPAPFYTRDSSFQVLDPDGREVGRFSANIVSGRGYPTTFEGVPMPILRGAALAPIHDGEGIFRGARGLVTVANWISIYPRQVSGFFVIRLLRMSPGAET